MLMSLEHKDRGVKVKSTMLSVSWITHFFDIPKGWVITTEGKAVGSPSTIRTLSLYLSESAASRFE